MMEFKRYQLVRRKAGNNTKYSSRLKKKYAIKKCWSDEILCYCTMAEMVRKMVGDDKEGTKRMRAILYHYQSNKGTPTMLRAWDSDGNEEMVWVDWDSFIEEKK